MACPQYTILSKNTPSFPMQHPMNTPHPLTDQYWSQLHLGWALLCHSILHALHNTYTTLTTKSWKIPNGWFTASQSIRKTTPPWQPMHNMNHNTHNIYFCPKPGYNRWSTSSQTQFSNKTALIRHLNTHNHKSTHHLTNYSKCTDSDIYHCCSADCPSSPKTFFASLRALWIHNDALHTPPNTQQLRHHTTPNNNTQHLPQPGIPTQQQ